MTDLYIPSDEQVAVAWLMSCPSIEGVRAATSLAAEANWEGNTFLQVATAPLASPPHPYVPFHTPRIIVSCWGRPKHWSDAADLSQLVRSETYRASSARVVTIPVEGFDSAKVKSVQALSEPVRVSGDPNNLTRYDIALSFEWVESHLTVLY